MPAREFKAGYEAGKRDKRDEMIHRLYNQDVLTGPQIAELVEIGYERVRQIYHEQEQKDQPAEITE